MNTAKTCSKVLTSKNIAERQTVAILFTANFVFKKTVEKNKKYSVHTEQDYITAHL